MSSKALERIAQALARRWRPAPAQRSLVTPPSAMDLALLQEAMSRRSSAAAAAALLQTFRDLLASLVGGSLAARLLQSAAPVLACEPPRLARAAAMTESP